VIFPPELRPSGCITARTGDTKNERIDPMRSLLTSLATFGVAGAIALGAVASASAATHHKRHAAPAAQDQMIGSDVQLAPRTNWQAVPPSSVQGPYGCVTDEGYGRYDACDVGGAS
jgi:hypothetical protein